MPRTLPWRLHEVHQLAAAPRRAAWLGNTVVSCCKDGSWWRACRRLWRFGPLFCRRWRIASRLFVRCPPFERSWSSLDARGKSARCFLHVLPHRSPRLQFDSTMRFCSAGRHTTLLGRWILPSAVCSVKRRLYGIQALPLGFRCFLSYGTSENTQPASISAARRLWQLKRPFCLCCTWRLRSWCGLRSDRQAPRLIRLRSSGCC